MTTEQNAPQSSTDLDRLWTLQALAEFLGVPEETLYAWRKRGTGPKGIRIGRYVRYRPEDVRSWLDELAKAA